MTYPFQLWNNLQAVTAKNLQIFRTIASKKKKISKFIEVAEISPVFKKLYNSSKDNQRPISMLSNLLNFLRASFTHN